MNKDYDFQLSNFDLNELYSLHPHLGNLEWLNSSLRTKKTGLCWVVPCDYLVGGFGSKFPKFGNDVSDGDDDELKNSYGFTSESIKDIIQKRRLMKKNFNPEKSSIEVLRRCFEIIELCVNGDYFDHIENPNIFFDTLQHFEHTMEILEQISWFKNSSSIHESVEEVICQICSYNKGRMFSIWQMLPRHIRDVFLGISESESEESPSLNSNMKPTGNHIIDTWHRNFIEPGYSIHLKHLIIPFPFKFGYNPDDIIFYEFSKEYHHYDPDDDYY